MMSMGLTSISGLATITGVTAGGPSTTMTGSGAIMGFSTTMTGSGLTGTSTGEGAMAACKDFKQYQ